MRAKFSVVVIVCSFFIMSALHAQERFWVNGSGSWHDATHWSESSGGTGGASVPTLQNKVIFDAQSFPKGTGEVTIEDKAQCRSLEVKQSSFALKSKSFLFKKFTNAQIIIAGDIHIDKQMRDQFFGDWLLSSDQKATIDIRTTLSGNMTLDNPDGEWLLKNDYQTIGDLLIKQGTLNSNGQNIQVNLLQIDPSNKNPQNFKGSEIILNAVDLNQNSPGLINMQEAQIVINKTPNNRNTKTGYAAVSIIPANLKGTKAAFKLETLTSTDVSCNGLSDGEIDVTVSGGNPDYTYNLYIGSAMPGNLIQSETKADLTHTFTGLPARSDYLVRASDNAGASFTNPITISEPDPVDAIITVQTHVTCFTSSDGELLAAGQGGDGTYNYEWFQYNFLTSGWENTGVTTALLTGVSQGRYRVDVTDGKGCTGNTQIDYVQALYPQIPDQITVNDAVITDACEGLNTGVITFTASGGTGDLDYSITTGGGSYQEDGTFSNLGIGTYETWVIDENGCEAQGNDAVVGETPAPTADAGADDGTCINKFFQVNDANASEYASYYWTVNPGANGILSNQTSLNAIYTPGPGDEGTVITLTLHVVGNGTCPEATDDKQITVYLQPTANAGGDGETCTNKPYTVSGAAVGNETDFYWTSDGAGTLTGDNTLTPTYTPDATDAGNTVTLTLHVVGNANCSEVTDDMSILVRPAPTANAGADGEVCISSSFTVNDASVTNDNSILWTVNPAANGLLTNATSLTPTYTPAAGDEGQTIVLTLTVNGYSNCDPASDTKNIDVYDAPLANAGVDASTCENIPHTIAGASANNEQSIYWTQTGGAGTLTGGNTLTPTYTPVSGDAGNIITLTLHAVGYADCGESTDNMQLTIVPAPTANAGANDNICVNKAHEITDATATNYNTLSWSIITGNGTLSDANTITPIYTPDATDAGNTITLQLTVTGNGNCANATDQVSFTVFDTPTANAGPGGEVCINQNITLAGASTTNSNGIYWTVDAGNGSLSNGTTLTPTYTPAAGDEGTVVTVTLHATGNADCDEVTASTTISVFDAPTANAGADASTCANKAYTINDASVTNETGILWTVNPGATGTLTNATTLTPTYTPGAGDAGNTVRLTITVSGEANCSDVTDFMDLTIEAAPIVSITTLLEGTCVNKAFQVTDASASNYNSLLWSVDAGAQGILSGETTITPTYTPAAGDEGNIVTLTLTAIGNANCDDAVATKLLNIFAEPNVNAGNDEETCVDKPFTIGTATADHTASLQWTVTSGNGVLANATTLTPTYTPALSDAGTTVILTLTGVGNANCDDVTDQMNLDVYALPVADAGQDEVTCVDKPFTVTDANPANYSALQWTIISGNGTLTNSTTLNPIYTPVPADAGNTIVLQLEVIGNANCDPTTDQMNLEVFAAPTANAGADAETCENKSHTLSGATTGNSSSAYWTITAGNGSLTNAGTLTPTYTPVPADAGTTVILTLHAVGNANCDEATDDMNLVIREAPTANAGTNGETCITDAYTINGASATNASSVLWTIDPAANGILTNANTLNPTYTPAAGDENQTYIITLTVNGNANCDPVTDQMSLTIYNSPTADAGADGETCISKIYTIGAGDATASNNNGVTWTITTGAGTLTNANTLTPTYTPAVGDETTNVVLTLHALGNAGCLEATDDMTIVVYEEPTANAGADATTCINKPYTFADASATSSSAVSWTLSPNANGSLDDPSLENPTYTPAAGDEGETITLTLTVDGLANCDPVTDQVQLEIFDVPTIFAGNDISTCENQPITINDATASDYASLQWTIVTGNGVLSNTTTLTPTYTPDASDAGTTVTLQLEALGNANCDPVTDLVDITIENQPTADAGSDDNTCENKAYTISGASATDATSVYWTITSGAGTLTNATTYTPTYTPAAADIGNLVVLTLHAVGKANCNEATDDMNLLVFAAPVANAGPDDNACVAQPYTVNGASVDNETTVQWDVNPGAQGTLINANTLTPTYTPATGDIGTTVTLTLTVFGESNCDPAVDALNLFILDAPTADAGADDATCENKPFTINDANATNYTAVLWTVNPGATGTLTDVTTLSPTYTPGAGEAGTTVTLTLTVSGNANCLDVTDSKDLYIEHAPEAIAGDDASICITSSYTVTGASVANNTDFYWTINPGASGILTDKTTLAPTYTPAAGDEGKTIRLTLHATGNANCDEVTDDVLISIFDVPTADAGPDATTCITKAHTITGASVTNQSDFFWTIAPAGNGTLTDETTLTPTYTPAAGDEGTTFTLTLHALGNADCAEVTDDMTLEVLPEPTADAGPDLEVCEGDAITVVGAVVTNQASVYWTLDPAANGTLFDDNLTTPTYQTGAGDEGNTLTLTLHAVGQGNCDEVTDELLITIYEAPEAYAGKDTTLCYAASYKLEDATANFATSYLWTTAGDGTFDFNNILTPTYTPGPADLANGSVELTLQVSGNAVCNPVEDKVVLTWAPELFASVGKPKPFDISATTKISVSVEIYDRHTLHDLNYFLQAPDGTILTLKEVPNGVYNFGHNSVVTFTTEAADGDILIVDAGVYNPPFQVPAQDLSGTYDAEGDWSTLHGKDPANGGWAILLEDKEDTDPDNDGFDGHLEAASISFTDISVISGNTETITYDGTGLALDITQALSETISSTTRFSASIELSTSCYGLCDATAVLSGIGGTPPYINTEWSYDAEFTNVFSTEAIVDLCAGKFYVRVTDANGCQAIDSVTVVQPPEIKIDNNVVVSNACFGGNEGSIMLEFSGGTGDLKYRPHVDSTWQASGYTFQGLPAQDYFVEIIDANNCTKDTTITITQGNEITGSYVFTPITCNGDANATITITGNGGSGNLLYSIDSLKTPAVATNSFTNLGPGEYDIMIQDDLGCDIYLGELVIEDPEAVTFDDILVTPTSCTGDGNDGKIEVVAHGGTGQLHYQLGTDAPQTDPLFTGLAEGDYEVTVFDDNGCTVVYPTLITVTGPDPIVIDQVNLTHVTVCFGDATGEIEIIAHGGSGNFEYSIDGTNYTTNNLFTGLTGGDYTIYVRDDLGCTAPEQTVTITQPTEVIFADIEVIHASECNASTTTGEITVTADGGTGAGTYTYALEGIVGPQAGNQFTNLDIGDYTVVITDGNGCEARLDTSIVLRPAMSAILDVEDMSCHSGTENGEILITIENGTGPYNYVWEKDGAPYTTWTDGAHLTDLSTGSYTVTITDSNQPTACVYTETVEISQPEPLVIAKEGHDIYCTEGVSDARDEKKAKGMIDISVSGGTPGYTYSWTGPGGFNSTDPEAKGLEIGTYSVTVVDANGCTISESVFIGKSTEFDVEVTDLTASKATICQLDKVTLNYAISGTTDSLVWQYTDLENDRGASSSAKYNPIKNDTILYPMYDTEYKLVARNEFCENKDVKITINVNPTPVIQIEKDTMIVKEAVSTATLLAELVNDPIDGTIYSWYPSEGLETPDQLTTSAAITQTQYYKFIATSTEGCSYSDSIYVLLVPNVQPYTGFSPNGDGINDYWTIENADVYENIVVQVFSRWGKKVYEQKGYDNNDPDRRWDGTSSGGNALPSGTYYYIIDVREPGVSPLKGPITIVR